MTDDIFRPDLFSERLYQIMQRVNPGIAELELYEFRYCLAAWYPEQGGWATITLDSWQEIETRIHRREFYTGIALKPRVADRIVLDASIVRLTQMLFAGLVSGTYSEEWVRAQFYFDIRGFYFLTRTVYFTGPAIAHLGGTPFKSFEPKHKDFDRLQSIGYKEFKAANAQVDEVFIQCIERLIAAKGTPILLTLAGPTAAGKTEIVERLREVMAAMGKRMTSIEMDSFLLDNDYRDDHGIQSLGKEAYHFEMFKQCLDDILHGRAISIPQYDSSISSHDPQGCLKPGYSPLTIEPADIILLEGNFPFQLKEVSDLIGAKIVYLTDDPIRLKRKWKRDMDYRKKYDLNYFRNRFFRTQFLRAADCYREQINVCDLVVDTTGAAIWVTPEVAAILDQKG